MANIKITVEGPLMDGHRITFKAPCDCSMVEKLDVRYMEGSTQKSKLFTMKDSLENDLTGVGNLFTAGAYVSVVLNPNDGSAYLLNANTSVTPVDNLESDRADLPLSARQGKILNDSLEEQPQFIYDENGKITGYTTKIGGADSVFPFKSWNTFNEIHRWLSSDNGWTRSYTFTEDYKCILIVAGGAIGNMVCDNGDLILNELFSDKLRVVVYHNVPKDTVCTFTSVNGTHCYAIYDVS